VEVLETPATCGKMMSDLIVGIILEHYHLQLTPFGAQYRLDDFMSAVLTVGSPVLAGYSLFTTILNTRWIHNRFNQSVNYPNSGLAVAILISLQQVPLRLHFYRAHFPSLVVLPENDAWWKYFSEFVDYTHTWSIAAATSIAWVVVAYILTVATSPSDSYENLAGDGETTGLLWLWLILIVVGWLQFSPKCNFDRLQAAYDRAKHTDTGASDAHVGSSPAFTHRALTITANENDVMSPDELLTPPVFNYSRSLQWAATAETAFQVFKAASEKAQHRIPVRSENKWIESDIGVIDPSNRRGSLAEISTYCALPDGAQRSHWAPGVFTRMAIASCAALVLQWGTVGAAVILAYFTPTTVRLSLSTCCVVVLANCRQGIGCRSLVISFTEGYQLWFG